MILKIGHLAKAIAHAKAIALPKWSVWVKNLKSCEIKIMRKTIRLFSLCKMVSLGQKLKKVEARLEIVLGLYPIFHETVVLAMNISLLTEPMQDWKTNWLSSLLITKRLVVSNKLLLTKNLL